MWHSLAVMSRDANVHSNKMNHKRMNTISSTRDDTDLEVTSQPRININVWMISCIILSHRGS